MAWLAFRYILSVLKWVRSVEIRTSLMITCSKLDRNESIKKIIISINTIQFQIKSSLALYKSLGKSYISITGNVVRMKTCTCFFINHWLFCVLFMLILVLTMHLKKVSLFFHSIRSVASLLIYQIINIIIGTWRLTQTQFVYVL